MPQPAAEESSAELTAAAERAELVGQIRGFLSWLGDGRKLTQTGRIGLADARYLVGMLGTGDTIDPKIGDRVFKTKSSEELGGLTKIVEWARAARLIRVTGTKLVPVHKNAALADNPLDLVLRLLETYPKLGKSLFPRGHWRQSIVGDEFTDISAELLTALLRSPGPCTLADLSDLAYDMIDARYTFSGITKMQHDHLRGTIEADVRFAMSALHVLGIVVLSRNSDEVNEYGGADWSKGTAELTNLIEAAEEAAVGMTYPACTAGEGACPPEDSGGTPGFADFKEIIAGPPSQERDELRSWAGEDYDPERFDLAKANAAVAAILQRHTPADDLHALEAARIGVICRDSACLEAWQAQVP
jgi:pRiA4b ORF-3-like protein